MEITNIDVKNFIPNPGSMLIDPIDKLQNSSIVATVDQAARPHLGVIVIIGDPKIDDKGNVITPANRVGQTVYYSIAGCEKVTMRKDNDPNHEYIVAPFNRILGGFNE